MTTDDTQGERIAKVLARAGLASRRDAEIMIVEGRVAVNGAIIDSPALNVTPADRITIDGRPLPDAEPPRLWLYHKPAGLVTTARDELGRDTIFDALPEDLPRVMTVGRLDLTSEGLLLLTNDGEIKRRLELPSTGWLRRYRVRVKGTPDEVRLSPLREGITLDGEMFQPMTITLDRQQGANAWLTIGIREGRNREIRRAMEAVGLVVNRLIRIGYGPFQLGDLAPGAVEEVRPRVLRDQLGLSETPMPVAAAPKAAAKAPPAAKARPLRGPQQTPVAGGRSVAVLRTPPNTLGRPRPARGTGADNDAPRTPRVARMDGPATPGAARPARDGDDRKPGPRGAGTDRAPRPYGDRPKPGPRGDRAAEAGPGKPRSEDRGAARPPRAEGGPRGPRSAEGAKGRGPATGDRPRGGAPSGDRPRGGPGGGSFGGGDRGPRKGPPGAGGGFGGSGGRTGGGSGSGGTESGPRGKPGGHGGPRGGAGGSGQGNPSASGEGSRTGAPRKGPGGFGQGPRGDGPRSGGPRSDGPRSDGPRSDRPGGGKPGGGKPNGGRPGGRSGGGPRGGRD